MPSWLCLQGNCKRDPESYQHDFDLQLKHFESLLELFLLKPGQSSSELSDLTLFLAHVSKSYPEQLEAFPQQLMDLLDKHASLLQPQLRLQMVQALVLLRHKDVLAPEQLLPLCFRLFHCQDKHLKALLHNFIISDIKAFNGKGCNHRLNRNIQNYMYKLIEVRCLQEAHAPARAVWPCLSAAGPLRVHVCITFRYASRK